MFVKTMLIAFYLSDCLFLNMSLCSKINGPYHMERTVTNSLPVHRYGSCLLAELVLSLGSFKVM